ncbi:M48 family metallopeptidase [Candidatus Nitrosacidococcus sp. I8]|uniref:M48 family metallopeptidase n=1 Tax=Candidatus Nitrosacidococcus sp. I8 TaxID=2942908 RepID=UPI0022278823|nr:M48 family metallopeptidase [Candidatus Nitrosacidococcus sp. I8]CAH9017805.1 Beta-barrel assembly-enhancing protease [Candidatus Nitrosacidococcus sp. I8]
MNTKYILFFIGLISLLIAACTTSPTGRHQLSFYSADEIAKMGDASYEQIKKDTPISNDPTINAYVQCVVNALTTVVPKPPNGADWKVTVFKEDQTINAFALPGGNIGVYTGILQTAKNADQLAAVIGHELGHVIADHGNARISTQYTTQASLQLIRVMLSGSEWNGLVGNQLMGLLGVGTQVGITLPFSRAEESEADVLGLEYMAKAGFNPQQSIQLWKNMMTADGGKTPSELLSTHPSNQTRIDNLEKHMPAATDLYQKAASEGKHPKCILSTTSKG